MIDLFQKGRELTVLEFDCDALLFNSLLLGLNRCNFNCVVSVIVLDKSIILCPHSPFDQNIFDLLSIVTSDVLWVVASCSILVGEVDKAVGSLSIEDKLANPWVDTLELFGVGKPIGSWKEELPKALLRALGNELSISKRFVVSIVVDHRSNVDQYLPDGDLIEAIL